MARPIVREAPLPRRHAVVALRTEVTTTKDPLPIVREAVEAPRRTAYAAHRAVVRAAVAVRAAALPHRIVREGHILRTLRAAAVRVAPHRTVQVARHTEDS